MPSGLGQLRTRRTISLTLAAGLTLAGASLHAHHSISGMYDRSKEVTVDGAIAQFRFVSPHPFIVRPTDIRRNRQPSPRSLG